MRLLLAPMEGLLDDVLRAVLTRRTQYDCVVTEFVRVSGALLPCRAFRRVAPELDNGSRTVGGTPLRVQLLGSDPACIADNALRLAGLAPSAVDLNFGCPAPTVNRHRGGAVLLDEPELLHDIATAVRRAMPAQVPLTAKMRLGVGDTARALDCARALADGGVAELVVHARTKQQGYRPPAHWEWVGRIAAAVAVPVVANGEVWTAADWRRCREVSGVADVMLGRGAVADPFLAARIARGDLAEPDAELRAAEWAEVLGMLGDFRLRVLGKLRVAFVPGRVKQWLNLLRRSYPQAESLFGEIRALRQMAEIDRVLAAHGVPMLQAKLAA